MKILYILSFISLLHATPSPITTEEIEHLKSTGVISATSNITDESRDFDKAVSEMWSDDFIIGIQNNLEAAKQLQSKLITKVSELQNNLTKALKLEEEIEIYNNK